MIICPLPKTDTPTRDHTIRCADGYQLRLAGCSLFVTPPNGKPMHSLQPSPAEAKRMAEILEAAHNKTKGAAN